MRCIISASFICLHEFEKKEKNHTFVIVKYVKSV